MSSDTEDRTGPEPWESFGVAIKAGLNGLWVLTFLTALEDGEIGSCARSTPPETDNEILDAAGSPSREWWSKYRAFCSSGAPTPPLWERWLHTDMLVELAPTLRIIEAHTERERRRFSRRPRAARAPALWSDIEVLAWLAGHDAGLVAEVRDFGHHDEILANEARASGLRYLRIQVALHHCRCGSNRPLLAMFSFEECACLQSAWGMMLECLQEARLSAWRIGKGDNSQVLSSNFLDADLRVGVGYPALSSQHGELLFKQSEVRSASSKRTAKRRGRPTIDDSAHVAEMHDWRAQNPGKTVREAAEWIEPEANKDNARKPDSAIRRLMRNYELKHPQ